MSIYDRVMICVVVLIALIIVQVEMYMTIRMLDRAHDKQQTINNKSITYEY